MEKNEKFLKKRQNDVWFNQGEKRTFASAFKKRKNFKQKMESIEIKGTKKEQSGTPVSRGLRREGSIPCVMYGKGESVAFYVPDTAFRHRIYTPKFKTAKIELDGTVHECIVKDVQFHPVTDKILHVDFLRLIPGHKLKVDLPLEFEGNAKGVKSGGKFLAKVRRIQVITTPESLVDKVPVNIAGMGLGSNLRVRDIPAIEGIEIQNNPSMPIASIEIPRALRSAQSKADAVVDVEEEDGEGEE